MFAQFVCALSDFCARGFPAKYGKPFFLSVPCDLMALWHLS